jgi:DNA repair photolyase
MAGADVQEIYCKTLLNKIDVPRFPFKWTMNPYRGCRHACTYCYARPTHEFLGMDSGKDFDTKVFAKVNAPEVLRKELQRRSWRNESIAIGTASDPYEPAEAEYKITRRLLKVLQDFHNPVTITTKGVLVRRDVDILAELSQVADVHVNFSIGTINEKVWRTMEPGTPRPEARLEAMQYLVENGVSAGVNMAPLLPGISDDEANMQAVAEAAYDHKAQYLSANVLNLKPGAKAWFIPLLKESYPHLVSAYNRLFVNNNTYAPQLYTKSVMETFDRVRRQWNLPERAKVQENMAPKGQLQMQFAFAA